MKEIFKKYKKALYILGAIIFLVAILILEGIQERGFYEYPWQVREPTQETPISTKPPLELERAVPPSGTVVETYADMILLRFKDEVDVETLDFTVEPEISLEARTFDDKKELYIFPDVIAWEEDVTYRITINRLKSLGGKTLKKPIVYEFTSSPDETIPMGDPPPQPGETF